MAKLGRRDPSFSFFESFTPTTTLPAGSLESRQTVLAAAVAANDALTMYTPMTAILTRHNQLGIGGGLSERERRGESTPIAAGVAIFSVSMLIEGGGLGFRLLPCSPPLPPLFRLNLPLFRLNLPLLGQIYPFLG